MKRHMSRRQWLVMLLMTFSIGAMVLSATAASEQAPVQVAKARGMIVFDAEEIQG